jgi:hypothetical protein
MMAGKQEHVLARVGLSSESQAHKFRPAFFDTQTNLVCLSRHADGRPAPVHLLDGLPRQWVLARNPSGDGAACRLGCGKNGIRNCYPIMREPKGGRPKKNPWNSSKPSARHSRALQCLHFLGQQLGGP